jgi:hypothetical protein
MARLDHHGIITAPEAAAGRTHRRNCRDLIGKSGLPPLLNAQGFSVGQRRMAAAARPARTGPTPGTTADQLPGHRPRRRDRLTPGTE